MFRHIFGKKDNPENDAAQPTLEVSPGSEVTTGAPMLPENVPLTGPSTLGATTSVPVVPANVPHTAPPTPGATTSVPVLPANVPLTAPLTSLPTSPPVLPAYVLLTAPLTPVATTSAPVVSEKLPKMAHPTSRATNNAPKSLESASQRASPSPGPTMNVPHINRSASVAVTMNVSRLHEKVPPSTSMGTTNSLMPQVKVPQEIKIKKEVELGTIPRKEIPVVPVKPQPRATPKTSRPSSTATTNDVRAPLQHEIPSTVVSPQREIPIMRVSPRRRMRTPPHDEADDWEGRPARMPRMQLRNSATPRRHGSRYPLRARREPDRLTY
ncbi:proline-rich protein 36-like [Dendropsophus ebraccatus]|uniref:proline-rich protein 36-like n=1 Tax=Dendropsophus ebraccatus TaxID=150705 RepID=UPI0038311F41